MGAVIARPALGQSTTLDGLGFRSGETQSEATGISADGLVVIGLSNNHAVSWNSSGVLSDLGAFLATGVNGDGTVIVGQDGSQNPVRWLNGSTTPTVLPMLTGLYFGGQANGVNADGSIIVGYDFGVPGAQSFI